MTLTIGWWAVPAFITFFSCYLAIAKAPDSGSFGLGGLLALLMLGGALILSLIAWLIWALVA